MTEFGKKSLLNLCSIMMIFAATGCQAPLSRAASPPSPQSTVGTMATQNLIIKFKSNTIVCDAAGITQLSSATMVTLEYIRPMSGDACVVRQLAGDANTLLQGQELLRRFPAIEWLERDTKKKAL